MDLWLAESFGDRQRFSGASYRAANWQALGWTRGFAKRQGRFVQHGQSKEVYVYVMAARMRQFIHGDVLSVVQLLFPALKYPSSRLLGPAFSAESSGT